MSIKDMIAALCEAFTGDPAEGKTIAEVLEDFEDKFDADEFKGDKGDDGDDGLWSEPVELVPDTDGKIGVNELLDALGALITIDTTTAEAELAKVTDVGVSTVPFGTADNKAAIETAILVLANALIDSANYTVTIAEGATYTSPTWEGKFVVTNDTTPLNFAEDAEARELTIVIAAE